MNRLAALFISILIAGCGLQPLYQGGENNRVVQALRSIETTPIDGRAGWLVQTALEDRLNKGNYSNIRYRLEVALNEDISGFGIRSDDSVTRERRTLRAHYRLIDITLGTILVDATAGSDAGIDVVSSEYATVAAEQTAQEHLSAEIADQIVSRIALYLSKNGNNQ